MSQRRYERYRDSGVEWLGELPADWAVKRLKHLAASIKAGPFGSAITKDMYVASGFRVYGQEQVIPNDFSIGDYYISSDDFRELEQYSVKKSDVLISCVGTFGKIALVPADVEPGIINPRLIRLRCNTEIIPEFLVAVLKSDVTFQQFALMSRGGTMDVINIGTLSAVVVGLPSTEEQRAIVTFLDRETAKIDALIAEQERLIALLAQKRQAVISHAVTKGLDPEVEMKDSGVEWLGEVPAHWDVMPIRLAAKLESGHTPSRTHPEYWVAEDCIHPWFTLADVWQIRDGDTNYVFETKECVSAVGLANSAARMLPKGTVMLSRTASVGFSTIMGIDMATTQDFANWVCSPSLMPEYLLWTFRGMEREFERIKYGSTHNTIYMPDLQAMRFARPPLHEQVAIVDHIVKSVAGFRELMDNARRGVELLQERRTALISAAVTGQIDVRERVGATHGA